MCLSHVRKGFDRMIEVFLGKVHFNRFPIYEAIHSLMAIFQVCEFLHYCSRTNLRKKVVIQPWVGSHFLIGTFKNTILEIQTGILAHGVQKPIANIKGIESSIR